MNRSGVKGSAVDLCALAIDAIAAEKKCAMKKRRGAFAACEYLEHALAQATTLRLVGCTEDQRANVSNRLNMNFDCMAQSRLQMRACESDARAYIRFKCDTRGRFTSAPVLLLLPPLPSPLVLRAI